MRRSAGSRGIPNLTKVSTQKLSRAGIGSFSNKALLSKALEMSLSDKVRAQDSVHFISSIAAK